MLKTMLELYEEFAKFSKSDVSHFRKLEQQGKGPKHDKASVPPHHNNQCSYPKQVHNINSDGCGPPENWEKNFGAPPQERSQRTFEQRPNQYH
jgi:hypothetical protein